MLALSSATKILGTGGSFGRRTPDTAPSASRKDYCSITKRGRQRSRTSRVLQLLAGGYTRGRYGISLCRPFFFLLLDSVLESSLLSADWLEDGAAEEPFAGVDTACDDCAGGGAAAAAVAE